MPASGNLYIKQDGTGAYGSNGPGMEYIKALKEQIKQDRDIEAQKPKDLIIGSFGIVTEEGTEILYNWKVDGYRIDNYEEYKPEPISNYGKSLLDSMFGGWK